MIDVKYRHSGGTIYDTDTPWILDRAPRINGGRGTRALHDNATERMADAILAAYPEPDDAQVSLYDGPEPLDGIAFPPSAPTLTEAEHTERVALMWVLATMASDPIGRTTTTAIPAGDAQRALYTRAADRDREQARYAADPRSECVEGALGTHKVTAPDGSVTYVTGPLSWPKSVTSADNGKKGGRPRLYATNADRQRAYRDRKRDRDNVDERAPELTNMDRAEGKRAVAKSDL